MVTADTRPREPSLIDRLTAYVERWELDLPLLPDVPRRVMMLADREDCDVRALTALLHEDAALAGHVLKVVRSPLYATRVPVVSLRQAVSLLGFSAIKEIAVLIACQSRVFKAQGFEQEVKELFQHCLATGFYAREIARLRRWNVEEAFLGGLLHDVGRPLLLQAVVDLGLPAPPYELQRALDVLHEPVGAMLADCWQLPESMSHAMSMHHADPRDENTPRMAVMVNLADALADLAFHRNGTELHHVLEHGALEPLSLYPDDVAVLADRADEAQALAEGLA